MVREDSTYEVIKSKEDFSEWYNQVLSAAGILDTSYDMKGMFVWMPYGLKIMKFLRNEWDKLFNEHGIEEVYFPQIVPMKYCKINKAWWEGFKEEGYKVIAGSDDKVQGALRPTGEPAIYPLYAQWVRTRNDLPIRMYETVSSFRYETKQTRPLIRDREITNWFEIHTCHATKKEAEKELLLHVKFLDYMFEEMLALPAFRVNKPVWECFPGAVGAYEYYSLLPDGKVMENGSANNLGQAYAKKFGIKFKDEKGKEDYAWMICTGNGGRFLAAMISEHGDNKGLILPPRIAPIQIVIIPIIFKGKEQQVWEAAEKVKKELTSSGLRVHLDARDITPGRKFNDWEVKGVPLRMEIGPREVENKELVIRARFSDAKTTMKINDLKSIGKMLDKIQNDMLDKSREKLKDSIIFTNNKKEIKGIMENKKIAKMYWCGNQKCYNALVNLNEGYEGFGTSINSKGSGKCPNCNKTGHEELFIAKSY
ncbi:proline--tRNA ligase [archaeon CG07_land_8_20_14_0_80_38_8]|nr:MAG: proline--tRNA ligase [archaeon CG07_land_8_20_14_0_80_38_8]